MNPTYEITLKNFAEGCTSGGISVMSRALKFSETPSFTPKSLWKPPKGHPSLVVFLNEIEKDIFAIPDSRLRYSNLLREEWQAMQSLADDRSIVIKKADKG